MLSGISSLGLATAVGGWYVYNKATRKPSEATKVSDPTETAPAAKIAVPGQPGLRIGQGVTRQGQPLLNFRGQTLVASSPITNYGPVDKVIKLRKEEIASTGAEKGPHQTRRPTPYTKRVHIDAWDKFDLNKMQEQSDSRHLRYEEFDDREFAYVRTSKPGATLFRPVRVAQGIGGWGYRRPPMDAFQR